MFALSFHEFAHAWMASKCGDNTAARMGRLTLNPMAHLDVMGSMMILFVGFGWAKPVPVDGRNLRNPRVDMMKVAAAGPLSNLLLAMISGISMVYIFPSDTILNALYGDSHPNKIIILLFFFFTLINIQLAIFNLIPVEPLDGSQIFSGYLMRTNPQLAWRLQSYGPQVLFGLILFGYITGFNILWLLMKPFVSFFMWLFAGISI